MKRVKSRENRLDNAIFDSCEQKGTVDDDYKGYCQSTVTHRSSMIVHGSNSIVCGDRRSYRWFYRLPVEQANSQKIDNRYLWSTVHP